MTRAELKQMEASLTMLVETRRQLGGFDANAEAILIVGEALLKINQHLIEKEPSKKSIKVKR